MMPLRPMTDPRVVKYALVRFQFFLAAGDKPDSALAKSIDAALKKQWSKRTPNMTHKNNIERYGTEYAELQRLVMAGNEENGCSEKGLDL